MVGKLGKAFVLVIVLALLTTGVVFAEDESKQEIIRHAGEITSVNLEESSFTLRGTNGEEFRFIVTDRTNFRSWDGEISAIDDLSVGMKALVLTVEDKDEDLIALMVAAGEANELPERMRSSGTIIEVDIEEGMFQLETKEGDLQEFHVGIRTRFRSRNESVNGLSDIDPGMFAVVIALDREDQPRLALWVGVAEAANRRERFSVIGEITNVIPGQGTFYLEARDGDVLQISVSEKTRFRSRDGSIVDIHDLKKGMLALVIGVRDGEGNLLALGVAAGYREDVQGLSKLDVKAIGSVISISDQSFTIESRNQGTLTFSVDGSTIYKSRNGSVEDFEDLQIGMIAAVGAKELGNGVYKAIIVGAGLLSNERPNQPVQDLPR